MPIRSDDHKQTNDFTALVKLPPGPHSLKFIVDKQWKTSKYLPSATDADGNLINYLQVSAVVDRGLSCVCPAIVSIGRFCRAVVKRRPSRSQSRTRRDQMWFTGQRQTLLTPGHPCILLPDPLSQVHKVDQKQPQPSLIEEEDEGAGGEEEEEDSDEWTSEIPPALVAYGDATEAALDAQEAQDRAMAERAAGLGGSASLPTPLLPQHYPGSSNGGMGGDAPGSQPMTPNGSHQSQNPASGGGGSIPNVLPNPALLALNRKPLLQLQSVQPPTLPAQLERGVLNSTLLIAKGSGDDNSILPKPDHSVLNHLAASPIKGGLLSVGVTTRYRRKVSESASPSLSSPAMIRADIECCGCRPRSPPLPPRPRFPPPLPRTRLPPPPIIISTSRPYTTRNQWSRESPCSSRPGSDARSTLFWSPQAVPTPHPVIATTLARHCLLSMRPFPFTPTHTHTRFS